MKFISVVHISTLASLASAGGFDQRDVNKPYASVQLSEALNIRGGGTKENLVTAFTALNGLHGIVSMAAPEKVPDIFYQGTFEIDEGTLAETYQEHEIYLGWHGPPYISGRIYRHVDDFSHRMEQRPVFLFPWSPSPQDGICQARL